MRSEPTLRHATLGDPLPQLDPRYSIERELGRGGMGRVFAARDLKLGREVAIKVLAPGLHVEDALRRFEQEARAAGSLDHPNVLVVHDIGSWQGGLYIVSELLEGRTLRSALEKGPLPLPKAVDYATQLARGLAAVHGKGITHRDLKPENIFITFDERVKILDFGIAKLMATPSPLHERSLRTAEGMILGTVGYMSPEQIRGKPADQRSDIFSVGLILYEMLSGRCAFGGSPLEAMHAALFEDPPPLAGEGIPPALTELVQRCLARDPSERFPSALDLCKALDTVSREPLRQPAPTQTALPARWRSVAVLPFRELGGTGDGEHLGLGLADATITELSQLGSLLVRSTAAILRYQRDAVDPQQAGRELSVDAVVDASFQRSGAQLRITVRLVSSADGRSLWARKIDASLNDVFRMQDEVSRSIARALELKLTTTDEQRLQRRVHAAAPRAEVYELYLRGRARLLRESFDDCKAAIGWFEKAVAADPGFAAAWAGIAEGAARIAFFIQAEGDWYERALAACKKALDLDPDLPEGHYLRAILAWSEPGGFDHSLAIRECQAAIAGRPGLDQAYMRLGVVLLHVGLIDEGIVELERALAISPGNEVARQMVGFGLHHQGRYQEALQISEEVARQAPSSWIHYQLAQCQVRLGRKSEARATQDLMLRQVPGEVLAPPIRGLLAALRGDGAQAREEVRQIAASRSSLIYLHHSWYDAACIHALLGDAGEAIDWLSRAAQGGYPCHTFFAADPWLASIRGDARYLGLMADLREESRRYERIYRGS